MKRYDSITAIKAVSCMMVFLSHWNGAFASWGHGSLDWFFLQSPFRMLTFGNMAVCIFLILSGTLVSLKIYRGSAFSWGTEICKRYVRMAIPIFGTHLLVFFLFRLGLFRTGQAAAVMGNEWLASYYAYPISLGTVFKNSFVTSVFRGDSSYYGPLWMMNYIFFGTVFSVVLAEGLKGMSKKGRVLFMTLLFGIFLVLDSYYLCFLMGNVMALLMLWLEKWKVEETERRSERKYQMSVQKRSEALSDGDAETGRMNAAWRPTKAALVAVSAVLFTFGVWLGLESFLITYRLMAHGIGMALGNASFWGLMSGFFMIWGVIFLWEILCCDRRTFWKWPLLWIGERSYSVFLVHWLVICTFSCGFYCRFIVKPNWFYLGVNFFATTAVMLVGTEVFYQLVEKRAFAWVWNRVKEIFL